MRVHWEGRSLPARPEQTVGAVLLANGVRTTRRTRREGRPRGLFCGIGACFDCLVKVDGGPDVRACLVPARDGMHVEPGGPPEEGPTGA